jgi:CheY-like chemotaxis protein
VAIIKHIRAQPDLQFLPIIVLSNAYITRLVQEAWQAGANQCLTKADCTPKALLEIVNAALAASSYVPVPGPAIADAAATRASPTANVQPPLLETAVGATFQAEIRQAFLHRAPQLLAASRARLQAFTKAESEAASRPELYALCQTVQSLAGHAGIAGLAKMSDLASALEALLKELSDKPKRITISSLNTVADTLAFLEVLLAHSNTPATITSRPAPALVVDDEIISRQAVLSALVKANLQALSVDDPLEAWKLLQEQNFSIIFLDVDMPGLNGFELCCQLRALPAHRTTPVVFVTSLTGFENRARFALSGGNDLIAKPFLLMELAVKALTCVLKHQMLVKC